MLSGAKHPNHQVKHQTSDPYYYDTDPTDFTDANATREFLVREKQRQHSVSSFNFHKKHSSLGLQNSHKSNTSRLNLNNLESIVGVATHPHMTSSPNYNNKAELDELSHGFGRVSMVSRASNNNNRKSIFDSIQDQLDDAESPTYLTQSEPSGNQPQQPDIDYLIRESAQDTPQLGNNLDILNIESTTSTPAVDVIAPISNNLVGDQGNEKLLSDEENEKLHRILCDFPNGFPLLLAEAKKSIISNKEMVSAIRKLASSEEDYAKTLQKTSTHTTSKTDGKSDSFNFAWQKFGNVHEKLAEVRVKFSEALNALADEMVILQRDTDRSRKSLKEGFSKRIKEAQDAENALEKAKSKYESCSDEWEKAQLAEMQQSTPTGNGSNNNSGKSMSDRKFSTMGSKMSTQLMALKDSIGKNFKKTEEDTRLRAAAANDVYKSQLQTTNMIRNEFYRNYLPQFVTDLKQTIDVSDDGLCQFLKQYGELTMNAKKQEIQLLEAGNGYPGISGIVDMINTRHDFNLAAKTLLYDQPYDKKDYEFVSYKGAHAAFNGHGNTKNNTFGNMAINNSASMNFNSVGANVQHSFGVDLVTLMEQNPEGNPVPAVVSRCIEHIESVGLDQQGIYRVSGTSTNVQKVKLALDRDGASAKLETVVEDIHAVTGALKMFFRELPDPLFPRAMYRQFIEAAKIEDPRLRLIQTHELINILHDANYATLKYLFGHLFRVQQMESENKMSISNLSIVFGPTLMDPPEPSNDPLSLKHQSLVIEIVLTNYEHIFDTD